MPVPIDYSERIPNNVGLAGDRRLQRALEGWQPRFLDWWRDLGPALPTKDVYLRTAIAVGRDGWAHFAHVPMEQYRWGIFLAERDPQRLIGFGRHQGEPAWQEVPGEHRAVLQRLIVIQGDTEPASVEQQRVLGRTAPSLYDLRNLFQVNVEEGRHLWAMVYLLHAFFGREGREEADQLLLRALRRPRRPAHTRRLQRGDHRLAAVLHVHLLHRPRRQVPARHPQGVRRSTRWRAPASSCSRKRRTTCSSARPASQRVVERTAEQMAEHDTEDVLRYGAIPLPIIQTLSELSTLASRWTCSARSGPRTPATYYSAGVKGRWQETRRDDDHVLIGAERSMTVVEDGRLTTKPCRCSTP